MQQPGSLSGISQWDVYVERLRKRLPAAPEALMSGYVRWAPWVAIVVGILGALALLAVAGLGLVAMPLLVFGGASAVTAGGVAILAALVGIATSALEVVGGVFMLRRRLLGWWILALGIAVSLLTNLLHVAIFGLIISLLIAYVHLEVKPLYR